MTIIVVGNIAGVVFDFDGVTTFNQQLYLELYDKNNNYRGYTYTTPAAVPQFSFNNLQGELGPFSVRIYQYFSSMGYTWLAYPRNIPLVRQIGRASCRERV